MFPGADYVKQLEYIINYVVLTLLAFLVQQYRKLTQKALLGDPHERGPGRDVRQRAGQVGRAYQQVGIRHKAETASRHKA